MIAKSKEYNHKTFFPLDLDTECSKYKCKGCDSIITADSRDVPSHCSECGAEYAYYIIITTAV
jgi:hypothetical protein